MNGKSYKVLKEIMSYPNGYISVPSIAFKTNMTCKQVFAMIAVLNLPFIHKEYDGTKAPQFRIDASDEERREVMRRATIEYYDISDEMMDKVYCALSTVGWLTISDITMDTDLNVQDVSKTLSVLPNIATKERGSSVYYRRCEQVL